MDNIGRVVKLKLHNNLTPSYRNLKWTPEHLFDIILLKQMLDVKGELSDFADFLGTVYESEDKEERDGARA